MIAGEKKLTLFADLITGKSGGADPGLEIRGPIKLTDRLTDPGNPPAHAIQLKSIGDSTSSPVLWRLEIDGGLKTTVSGISEFKKSLRIKQDFQADTGKIKNLDVKGTGHFLDNIEVTTDAPKVVISGKADIQKATIYDVHFGSLDTKQTRPGGPPDLINHDSHSHGVHTHPMYVPVGHSHPCNCILPTCQGCDSTCCGGCYGPPCPPPPPPPPPPSSRTLKRNIKPLKDYEKSLQNIANTPLFTWQYKKDKGDHPEKVRMGIISEELPKSLQILEKGKPSTPDWLSIYGTLWAGIKALNQKLQELREKSRVKLAELSKELKAYFTNQTTSLKKDLTVQIASLKTRLTEIKQGTETHSQNTKEFSELKKQFQEAAFTLKNRRKELNKIRTELKSIQQQLKEAESI